jgi:hypothetical protein
MLYDKRKPSLKDKILGQAKENPVKKILKQLKKVEVKIKKGK